MAVSDPRRFKQITKCWCNGTLTSLLRLITIAGDITPFIILLVVKWSAMHTKLIWKFPEKETSSVYSLFSLITGTGKQLKFAQKIYLLLTAFQINLLFSHMFFRNAWRILSILFQASFPNSVSQKFNLKDNEVSAIPSFRLLNLTYFSPNMAAHIENFRSPLAKIWQKLSIKRSNFQKKLYSPFACFWVSITTFRIAHTATVLLI